MVLIEHFLKKYSQSTGKEIKEVSPDALLLMMDYDWPGNVRELENAIEHAFVICQDEKITPLHLPRDIRPAEYSAPLTSLAQGGGGATKRKKLTKEETALLLEKFDYNMSEAARYIGVDRTTLWRWVKKYDLQKES